MKFRRRLMKGLPFTILALVFTFFSLISLLLVPKDSGNQVAISSDNSERVSEAGLRFSFQR
jgi:hypothetical protein